MPLHLNVLPFQETLYMSYCGPGAMKILLNYYGGPDKTEAELADLLRTTKSAGTLGRDMVRVAQELGFKAQLKDESSLEEIEEWLKKGVPPIVNWFTPGRPDYEPDLLYPEGHYSVVCGIDDAYIYLQDPETGGMRKIPRDTFMNIWFDYEGDIMSVETLTPRRLIAVYK